MLLLSEEQFLSDVQHGIWIASPYGAWAAAAQARLEMLKKAVQLAADNPALAGTVLGVEVAKELFHHEDHSRMLLQPFLHGERCVSLHWVPDPQG